MTKYSHVFVAAAIGLVVVGCHSGSSGSLPDGNGLQGVAATVNGETITLPEFSQHTDLKQTVQVMTPQGAQQTQVIGNLGLQSLQELVDQKVLMQMAKEQGVLPTDADVEAEVKLQTAIRKDYMKLLEDQGWTDAQIRQELAIGLARQHLVMKGVDVSPKDVDDYIKSHPEKFSDPALATIYFIEAKTDAKKAQVDKRLAAKDKFSVVASLLSDEPHARSTGGLFASKDVSKMPPKIQQIVNETPVKGTSNWVKFGPSFFKFYVDEKVAAKSRSVSDAQKELVRRLIAMEKGEAKNNFTKQFYEKLKAAKVEVSVPYLRQQWQKTWDQMSDPTTKPQ
ncbi:MAG: SurA N-terminal domain-containing protein [Fimbriimonas sp.]|nr:SurA N-terminal domain-containing protein [Fimbriimonas sp.]